MDKQPVSYLQSDAKWGSLPYTATGDKSQTIKSSGCGPTCAAMIAATYIDPKITPKEACAWSVAHGYRHATQGTLYSFFKAYGKILGLDWAQINNSNLRGMTAWAASPYHAKALDAIHAGKLVICCMGPGNWTTSGHYVLWWGYDEGMVYINDPISTKANRTKNTLVLLQAEVKYYFVCSVPQEDEMTEKQFDEMMTAWMARQNARPEDAWSIQEGHFAKATAMKVVSGSPKEVVRKDVLIAILGRLGLLK